MVRVDRNKFKNMLFKEQPEDLIRFDENTQIEELTDEPLQDSKNEKIFYLDKNNNLVSEEEAVRSVIQVYDDDGRMIEEVWSVLKEEKNVENDTEKYVMVYVDEEGNEVEQDKASYTEFRKYVEGKLVSQKTYPIIKDNSIKL